MKKFASILSLGISALLFSSCCGVATHTAQGASGEPHIGQIPTVKALAE
ncbi:MAG: hypothetical protein ACON5H_07715 [Akkermansiaceae bacterium]